MFLGYTRVSRVGDRGERLISPDQQAERIRSYASSRGLEVEMLPPELDQSGGKADRPILQAAIARIVSGESPGVIVAQLDRLSRMDIADALAVIRTIEDAGGQVIAVAENFDAGTPEGRLARNMMLSLGEMQLDRYKAQFAGAKRQAVKRGIWPFPIVPIGYRRAEGRGLEPDPGSAPLVAEAFRMRLGGASWPRVGEHLGRGVSGAMKVLANRVYLGEIRLRVDGELVVNATAHEPLVDRATFEAVNRIRGARPARGKGEVALLAGVARCAHCSRAMTRDVSGSRGGSVYRCQPLSARGRCPSPAIMAEGKLDEHVLAGVLPHLQALQLRHGRRTARLDVAEKAVDAAQAELDAFQEVTRVTDVGADSFRSGLELRADAVEQARQELATARAEAGPDFSSEPFAKIWENFSGHDRNHLLRSALDAVWVRRGRGPASERVLIVVHGFGGPLSRAGRGGDLPLRAVDFAEVDRRGIVTVPANGVGEEVETGPGS